MPRAPKITVNGDSAKLIGVNAACELMGIANSNFKRYRDRLTEVPVEGGAAVFVKAEVQALAREIKRQRRQRERGA